MARILMTSLGNGSYNKVTGHEEYRPANYYIDIDGVRNIHQSAYMYDALMRLRGYDKIILIGTAGSNWHLLYEHLFDKDCVLAPSMEYDEDYSLELLRVFEQSGRHKLKIDELREKLTRLKDTMGPICADIVVLHYGIDAAELTENFNLLAALKAHIKSGDSISFDITHSFRSLAIYELLAVSYFKDTMENVSLDYVSYGMLEFARENDGLTPIVDLSQLVKMLDWLKAAEEYNRYGTTALLAQLLEVNAGNLGIDDLTNAQIGVLKSLGGDAISTNDLNTFRDLIRKCERSVKSGGNVALDHIFSDLSSRFSDKLDDDMLLRTELAKWHIEKGRYINAVTTFNEATIKYCADLKGVNVDKWEDSREISKSILDLYSKNDHVNKFKEIYKIIHTLRNKLCHVKPFTPDNRNQLKREIDDFLNLYRCHFKGNCVNEADLKEALLE
jgi:CRISPR-associated Csx2 family protein